MIYFTAHTFKCVCHCRREMFRVLGMYNFAVIFKLKNDNFKTRDFSPLIKRVITGVGQLKPL